MTTTAAVLECVTIAKSFGGVRALAGVSLDVRAGEVHALVGENGAGKSTLIGILTGALTPDSGTLIVGGEHVGALDPAGARALKIVAIHQQPSLFPHLTVAENIALALEPPGAWRRVDWRARARSAATLLARVGASIDPTRPAATLRPSEQQLVEIAKALGADARIVLMDEPTASLTSAETDRLMAVVDGLRATGVGVIYISHRLEEVFRIADRVTVLRDGATVATRPISDVTPAALIAMMVGRELTSLFPRREAATGPMDDPALELAQVWNRAAGVRDVSLAVRRGEILGIAGLVGSGRTELAETIFGLTPADAGDIRVSGRSVRIDAPAAAIACGIGYVPKDRRLHGVVPEMDIAANATLASLPAISRRGVIDRARERSAAERFIQALRIKAPGPSTEVAALSGGNQQKVAMARWLMTGARILVLDEPTQGVDVGAKAEIHALISDQAAQGAAVLMISSELEELLGTCDRIAVMRGGAVAGIVPAASATAPGILALALGH